MEQSVIFLEVPSSQLMSLSSLARVTLTLLRRYLDLLVQYLLLLLLFSTRNGHKPLENHSKMT